jgi:hypothetical protein
MEKFVIGFSGTSLPRWMQLEGELQKNDGALRL